MKIQPNACIIIMHRMLSVLHIHCLNTRTCKICMRIKYYKPLFLTFKAIIKNNKKGFNHVPVSHENK